MDRIELKIKVGLDENDDWFVEHNIENVLNFFSETDQGTTIRDFSEHAMAIDLAKEILSSLYVNGDLKRDIKDSIKIALYAYYRRYIKVGDINGGSRTVYSSNDGKYHKVNAPGLYIPWVNQSGDRECLHIPMQYVEQHLTPHIESLEHAQSILETFHTGDWENGKYYATAVDYFIINKKENK